MWPLPKIQYEQICIVLDACHATCGWITQSSKKQLTLKAYKIIAWEKSTPILTKELNDFVQQYQLHNALLTCAVSNPLIHEQLIRVSTASPAAHELAHPLLKKILWDYRYLHTLDDGQSLFYVCGISRPLLFSHHLLAQQTMLHLMNITSGYMALISAYARLFGTAFRRSQLAIDLLAHDYQLEKSMNVDSIARLLHIDPAVTLDMHEQKVSLLTMIGLLNQERMK